MNQFKFIIIVFGCISIFSFLMVILLKQMDEDKKTITAELPPMWEYRQVAPWISLLTTPDGQQYIINWKGGMVPYTPKVSK